MGSKPQPEEYPSQDAQAGETRARKTQTKWSVSGGNFGPWDPAIFQNPPCLSTRRGKFELRNRTIIFPPPSFMPPERCKSPERHYLFKGTQATHPRLEPHRPGPAGAGSAGSGSAEPGPRTPDGLAPWLGYTPCAPGTRTGSPVLLAHAGYRTLTKLRRSKRLVNGNVGLRSPRDLTSAA